MLHFVHICWLVFIVSLFSDMEPDVGNYLEYQSVFFPCYSLIMHFTIFVNF